MSQQQSQRSAGKEFQVVGAEQRKARPEKEVLSNGSDSRGAIEERKSAECGCMALTTPTLGLCCV